MTIENDMIPPATPDSEATLHPVASPQSQKPNVAFAPAAMMVALRRIFDDPNLQVIDPSTSEGESAFKARLKNPSSDAIALWGRLPLSMRRKSIAAGLPVYQVDEGFLRGPEMPGRASLPVSFVVDNLCPYYDPSAPSRLEVMLATHDFSADPDLMQAAETLIGQMLSRGVGSFSHGIAPRDMTALYGPKTRKRVLVLGHHPEARALLMGNVNSVSNVQALLLARREHPGAQIIFKPHPQFLAQSREACLSEVADHAQDALVLDIDIPLALALDGVDQVVTVCSLGGFEAALRGLPVTVLGAPFYAGWGITDDRAAPPRRTRRLSVTEVFAAAYLQYPIYFDPLSNRSLAPSEAVEIISAGQKVELAQDHSGPHISVLHIGRKLPAELLKLALPHQSMTTLSPNDPNLGAALSKHVAQVREIAPSMQAPVVLQAPLRAAILNEVAEHPVQVITIDPGFVFGDLDAATPDGLSILVATRAPHYDSSRVSDLEHILSTYDFDADQGLMTRARALMPRLVTSGFGRFQYQFRAGAPSSVLPEKNGKRVLVIGHNPAEQGTILSNPRDYDNLDLIRLARREHPKAEIVFRPHPSGGKARTDMVAAVKAADPAVVIQDQKVPLADILASADHVVTLASLGGFEAALRGIPVTTFGTPFYAGWGITDDRAAPERRTRRLTLDQVFAGAYLLYPTYFDPLYKDETTLESILALAETAPVTRSPQELVTVNLAKSDFRLVSDQIPSGPDSKNIYLFGFNDHKAPFIAKLFPNDNIWFPKLKAAEVLAKQISTFIFPEKLREKDIFLIWGRKEPVGTREFCTSADIQLHHMEDGFIRSVDLGGMGSVPLSYAYDTRGIYFDPNTPSDLEEIILTHDFEVDKPLMKRAQRVLETIKSRGVSKYNLNAEADLNAIFADTRRKILVIGQVEDDASIQYGCATPMNNNDLVRAAAIENPDALIIYKPHPDVLMQLRAELSDPEEVASFATILRVPFRITDILDHVDEVYTITSLAGFEAAMRGKKVTTFGCPFYSGWGFTNDRQHNPRRTRKVTVEQVFAAAYLLYPKYIDPFSLQQIDAEKALDLLAWMQKHGVPSPVIGREKRSRLYISKSREAYARGDSSQAHALLAQAKSFSKDPDVSLERAKLWLKEQKIDDTTLNELRRAADLEKSAFADERFTARLELLNFLWQYRRPSAELESLVRSCARIPKLTKSTRLSIAACLNWLGYSSEAINVAKVTSEIDHIQLAATLEDLSPKSQSDIIGMYAQSILQSIRRGNNRLAEIVRENCESFRLIGGGVQNSEIEIDQATFTVNLIIMTGTQGNIYPNSAHKSSIIVRGPRNIGFPDPRMQAGSSALIFGSNLLHTMSDGRIVFSRLLSDYSTLGVFPETLYYSLCERLGFVPSSDLVALAWLHSIIGPVPRSTILGCDFLNSASSEHDIAETFIGEGRSTRTVEGQATYDTSRRGNPSEDLGLLELSFADKDAALVKLFSNMDIERAAITSPTTVLEGVQKYLQKMIRAGSIVCSRPEKTDFSEISAAELFLQWGIRPNAAKAAQADAARAMGRPVVIIEDGFLRSLAIGLSGDPALSIILDDKTAYYDATRPSRLEMLMQDGPDLTPEQHARARKVIDLIRARRLSKYNHAPDTRLQIGEPGRPKLLLIDQRFGDQSIVSGLASEESFNAMLFDAVRERPDHDIIVKQHPDAIGGGKLAYFTPERLAQVDKLTSRLHPIAFDVNPHALFDLCDEAWVATSGMGFEALMAGLPVRCYGVPWYAGWGLTEDKQTLPRRTRARDIEAAFHFAWIALSRYVDPEAEAPCEIEDLIDHICRVRGW